MVWFVVVHLYFCGCVLSWLYYCLFLLTSGTMMDCFDGQKSTEKQSGDQRENSIKEPPGLLEVRHINT